MFSVASVAPRLWWHDIYIYNIWPQNIVIITIVSLQGNTTSFLIIKYLTITYSTFPFPGIVVMPYVFVAGTFLYELPLSYDSYLSFSYCRNIVGENIFLDILLGILLTAVASALFKTFLF